MQKLASSSSLPNDGLSPSNSFSNVSSEAFQDALVNYYSHLMCQVQQNLVQMELLRTLQDNQQGKKLFHFGRTAKKVRIGDLPLWLQNSCVSNFEVKRRKMICFDNHTYNYYQQNYSYFDWKNQCSYWNTNSYFCKLLTTSKKFCIWLIWVDK